jgi:UPF0755 protein
MIRFRGVSALIPLLLVLGVTVIGVQAYLRARPRPAEHSAAPVIVYIKPKTSVQDIAAALREAGVIRHRWAFLAVAYLQGSLKRLQAGEYEFPGNASILDILRKLESGRVVTHQVTLPEGITVQEIASLLAGEKLVDPERFVALCEDPAFASGLGIHAKRLEGYLFPDTYRLTRGMAEEEIIRLMVERFRQALPADFAADAERLHLTLHGVVTLASLIEKEARLGEERPLVSAVFHNRLRLKMPLQSDPTAVYLAPRVPGRITAADLQRASPYNTYLFPGLPAGPIANAGLASLVAALRPARAPFLYFVAKNDGSHFFSRTLEQHQRAVRLYQGSRAGEGRAPASSEGTHAAALGRRMG